MSRWKLRLGGFGAGLALFLSLIYWYQWSASALSNEEIDQYISVIEAQTQIPGAKHDIRALRKLLEGDDGEPIYTVNLYKFHSTANYPEGSDFGGTGEEAYDRFSKVMISLMLQRGSHPVYGSYWVDASSEWDRIVIVRYRSRHDLVDLFATDAFAEASLHKWASIKEHQRMVVQATHIPDGLPVFLIISMVATIAVFICLRLLPFKVDGTEI